MQSTLKNQNLKLSATKRIMKDIQDLDRNPIAGIGVHIPDMQDPFTIHCNVLINDGPYTGIMIHLILHIPQDYPLTGPAGNIAPGLEFDSRYHAHIHEDYQNGHSLCNDLLTNFAGYFKAVDSGGPSVKATGWSPGYTLSTALLQIVTFFADPDFFHTPKETGIAQLREMSQKFCCRTCGHTHRAPVPLVAVYRNSSSTENSQDEWISVSEVQKEREKLKKELMEKLTCGVTKQNVIEDKICLGYPIYIKRDRFGRLWPEIILELISYDAFVAEIQKAGIDKLDFYEKFSFRSVTGADYNYWLPIFINLEHYKQGEMIIKNAISILSRGSASGTRDNEFSPDMALSVLCTMMNKTAVRLFNGAMHESQHAIEAYCHLLRLLMFFIDTFPSLEQKIDDTLSRFIENPFSRHKKTVPDIGELMIKIALSKKYSYDGMKTVFCEEYFARQIFWIMKNMNSVNFWRIQRDNLMSIFEASKVSCHLLVFYLAMTETFVNKNMRDSLDGRFGFPEQKTVENFQNRLKTIKAISSYSALLPVIRLADMIDTPEKMIQWLQHCVIISNKQQYTNIPEGN